MSIGESKVKRWGNSLGIVISKDLVEEMKLKEGQEVSVDIIQKEKPHAFGIVKKAKSFQRDEESLDR